MSMKLKDLCKAPTGTKHFFYVPEDKTATQYHATISAYVARYGRKCKRTTKILVDSKSVEAVQVIEVTII